MTIEKSGHPAQKHNPNCCAEVEHIDQLCPACLNEWERWMEETAGPQLRAAIATEERHAAA